MEIRKGSIGDDAVARIYTGDDLIHPLPVQDGLVLWYDFMGRRNSDAKRGIAEDLSGNGNDGELTNFAYATGSGYEDDRELDGENLIEKTNYVEKSSFHIITDTGEKMNGQPIFRGEKTTTGSPPIETASVSALPGQSFTFTGYVKLGSLTSSRRTQILFYDRIEASVHGSVAAQNTTEWQRLSITFTNVSETTITDLRPYFYLSADDGDVTFFSSFMLTEGTEEIEYRPSRKDPLYDDWAKNKGFRRGLRFDGVDDVIVFSEASFTAEDSWTAGITVPNPPLTLNSINFPFGLLDTGNQSLVFSTSYFGYRAADGTYISSQGLNCKLHKVFYVTYDGGNFSFYVGGNLVGAEYYPSIARFSTVGGGYTRSYRLEGLNLSALLYNRALTPEEIAHNYAIEKERWNL